jgi:hypothetical protein
VARESKEEKPAAGMSGPWILFSPHQGNKTVLSDKKGKKTNRQNKTRRKLQV